MSSNRTIAEELLPWFRINQRTMPWRKPARDPYEVWVSEIMLQQTTVATVIPYFLRWMDRFPTIDHLANASLDEVLASWQGLGYYSRAKRLYRAARMISEQGSWPSNYDEWLEVPGVGLYTAAAISSLALNQPRAVVDGNVERVYSRLTDSLDVGSTLKNSAASWASLNMPAEQPGEWNEALMELGAVICTPTSPQCESCPLSRSCQSMLAGTQILRPVRQAQPDWKIVRHIAWIPFFDGLVGIRKIPEEQWWGGMWEFPRAESSEAGKSELSNVVGDVVLTPFGLLNHVVTRHKVQVEVFRAEARMKVPELTWVEPAELSAYALPTPARRMFKLIEPL